MVLGIYGYIDRKYNKIVYIGKDSNIDKNVRKYAHMQPSSYDKQSFNRILQNNPNRYTYQVFVWDVKDQDTLNALEIQNIRQLKPKFNYTDGGDGICGFKHSNEAKKKMSEAHKGESNGFFGRKHSDETKNKISNTVSLRKSTTGFYRVSKVLDLTCKQGFYWKYRYIYSVNNKRTRQSICSVDLLKLKKRVESQGLVWRIIDKNKAQKTLDSIKL